ncbi:D-glycerate dehydrogenase [soil metagenome]
MMSKPVIVVTRQLPDAGMNLLAEASDVETRVWPHDLPPSREELLDLLRGASAAITLVTDPIDGPLLDALPDLKTIANCAVGYDNIDVPAATERGVLVCNTPGVLTETTADFAFALVITAARRIVEAADYVREGRWKTWSPNLFLGQDLHDATIGIIGFGRIGQEVAKRAAGFSMRILTIDRGKRPDVKLEVEYTDLDSLLRESDFVCLTVALNDETRGLIGSRELGLMKPTAMLINAARGPVVQTDALLEALTNGTIAAAALDVTDPEPLPADHPLVSLPNCVIVPHIASATVATRSKMATMAVNTALSAIRGTRPANLVNPEAWKHA